MFFYRSHIVRNHSTDELISNTSCPICGNPLTKDPFVMALRYSPVTLFRVIILAFAFATLLAMIWNSISLATNFLSQFSATTQMHIIISSIASVSIPLSFFIVTCELKLSHFPDKIYGLRCQSCRNAFLGVVNKNKDIPIQLKERENNVW